jgi:hypothetical protein
MPINLLHHLMPHRTESREMENSEIEWLRQNKNSNLNYLNGA